MTQSPIGYRVGLLVVALGQLSLRPDHYFVRGRTSDYILEGEVIARTSETLGVRDDLLHRIEYARLVRKGGTGLHSVSGPIAGFTFRTPLRNGSEMCAGAFAGYTFTLSTISLSPRIDACFSSFDNQSVRAAADDFGGGVRVAHAWDIRSSASTSV